MAAAIQVELDQARVTIAYLSAEVERLRIRQERRDKAGNVQVPTGEDILALSKKLARQYNKSSAIFALQINPEALRDFVDPRETIANTYFPEYVANFLFGVFKHHYHVPAGCFSAALICAFVSVLGWQPEVGYGTLAAIPYMILLIVHFNVSILKSLFESFEYVSLLVLSVVSFAGFIDSVSHSPPRVIALICVALASFTAVTIDAKIPSKKIRRDFIFLSGFAAAMAAALVSCWYAGIMTDVKQRIIIVGTVSIDFQSISASCLGTFVVLITKYTVVLVQTRNTETNVMLIAKPHAWYRLVKSANGDPLEQFDEKAKANAQLAVAVEDSAI